LITSGTRSETCEQKSPEHETRSFWILYLALVAIAFAANFPGRANSDTVGMFLEATDLIRLDDWHSPFITFVYGFLGPLFGYPAGGLVAQSFLLMAWPALIGAKIGAARLHPIVAVAAYVAWGLVCALFIALSGQIIKDMLLVSFMSFFLFLEMQKKRGPEIILLKLICVLGIILIRPVNGALILPALAVKLLLSEGKRKGLILLSALAVTIAVSIAVPPMSRILFGAQKANPEFSVIVFDMGGISTNLHENLFRELDSKMSYPDPWTCYAPNSSYVFMWGRCKQYFEIFTGRNAQITALWKRSIMHHPIAYLRHRADFAVKLLDLDGSGRDGIITSFPLFDGGITNTPQGMAAFGKFGPATLQLWHPTIAFDPFGRFWNGVYATFLGFPATWCILIFISIVLAFVGTATRRKKLVMMVGVFGLSNVVLFIFLGPENTQRYLLPTWFCAVADLTLVLSLLLNDRRISGGIAENPFDAKPGRAGRFS
jgi:hypothetical protein